MRTTVKTILEYGGYQPNAYTGIKSFWLSPDCKLIEVNNHIAYARRLLLSDESSGIYPKMRAMGWSRLVLEGRRLLLNPQETSERQVNFLRKVAQEKHYVLVDELTGREVPVQGDLWR